MNTPTGPLYPEVTVKLSGSDGNAFAIMGRVSYALKRAGIASARIKDFYAEATLGDYNHLIQTCMKWVTVK